VDSGDGEGTAAALAADAKRLDALREAAKDCRACALWQTGTQTVFGEGLRRARVVMVGEQPGDREDRAGRPFVGPAGGVLDRALAAAGIDRGEVYLTNVVKHFRWERQGKRRIHKRPAAEHVTACRPWLDAELRLIRPTALVCLGATAAQALLGPSFRVTRERGRPVQSDLAPLVMATVHPSSILRAADETARDAAFAAFVDDLQSLARQLAA
jgi:uracil-DNA glycosylase